MAGYVFAIGGDEDPVSMIRACAEKGIYSTYLKGIAPLSFEGTLADYMSMKPGDNIYFFCKRRYYGIGELISIGPDCKYCNYPRSSARVNVQYLIKHRSIARDVVARFAKAGLLYEDAEYHNAVFVGTDTDGVPRHAHKRSANSYGKAFRLNVEGSDPRLKNERICSG